MNVSDQLFLQNLHTETVDGCLEKIRCLNKEGFDRLIKLYADVSAAHFSDNLLTACSSIVDLFETVNVVDYCD